MLLPVQITSKQFLLTPAIETHIRKRTEKLSQFYDRISSCRVVVDLPKKHMNRGRLYSVRIDMTVPGKELVVTNKEDKDIYVAIREAFNAITRQLEEFSQKRHGRVKTHSDVMHGHITRVIPDEGYGFISGNDGIEYYFSITNLGNVRFAKLMAGDAVEFIAEVLNDGWQAHHVIKERRNHIAA